MRGSLPGVRFSDHYRTVAEGRILDMLLLAGSAYELDQAEAIAARRQALDEWIDLGLGVRRGPRRGRGLGPVEVEKVVKRLRCEGRHSLSAVTPLRPGRT